MQIMKGFAGKHPNQQQKKVRRVLIIVQNLPLPFDRRVWEEANTLRQQGYEVSIICPQGKGYTAAYECLNGIHIYRHPLPHEASGAIGYFLEYAHSLFWEFLLSWKIYSRHGFDVIHACNPPDLIFLVAGFFRVFMGKKFLFDHHDLCPELYEAKFKKRGFGYRLMLCCERLTFLMAQISIATNESYKQIAITRGKMPPERVFVVRSGPNLARMKIQLPQDVYKQGRNFLVGYLGVMGAQEGIHYLIEAIRYLVYDKARTDIQFALIGGGPALQELQQLAREYRVQDYVTFTGRIPDEEMLAVLNTADICVNPDEVNAMNDKSTMNKIMEYMALAKPIIQFDVTEGRVSAAESSLYATPNDAHDMAEKIIELLAQPALRAEMGRIGRERVEKTLAWEHEAPKLLKAYETLFQL